MHGYHKLRLGAALMSLSLLYTIQYYPDKPIWVNSMMYRYHMVRVSGTYESLLF